jgi:hypothetical protein
MQKLSTKTLELWRGKLDEAERGNGLARRAN